MKKILFTVLFLGGLVSLRAEEVPDSLSVQKKVTIEEVVVTGTRNETDVRHLPMTVSVVTREQIEHRKSLVITSFDRVYSGTFHDFQRADGIWGIRRGCRRNEFTGNRGRATGGITDHGDARVN